MDLDKWFAKSLQPNVSPVTYIIFIAIAIRGFVFSLPGNDPFYFWPAELAMGIAAALAVIGFIKENKSLVAKTSATVFLVQLYNALVWIQTGDPIQAITVSFPLATVAAYVFWTNSMDRLWGFTPRE
jgi:hypothetical protein